MKIRPEQIDTGSGSGVLVADDTGVLLSTASAQTSYLLPPSLDTSTVSPSSDGNAVVDTGSGELRFGRLGGWSSPFTVHGRAARYELTALVTDGTGGEARLSWSTSMVPERGATWNDTAKQFDILVPGVWFVEATGLWFPWTATNYAETTVYRFRLYAGSSVRDVAEYHNVGSNEFNIGIRYHTFFMVSAVTRVQTTDPIYVTAEFVAGSSGGSYGLGFSGQVSLMRIAP